MPRRRSAPATRRWDTDQLPVGDEKVAAVREMFDAIAPRLAAATRQALAAAGSQQEWNGLLLSSPELMHR